MKYAYLFAIEIDQWGKKLDKEIVKLVKHHSSPSIIGLFQEIKKNMALLAICITGSLDEKENQLISQILMDCKLLEASSHDYPQLSCRQVSLQLQTLLDTYQQEKKIPEQDMHDAITAFNKMTHAAAFQSTPDPKKIKSGMDFLRKQETTLLFHSNKT